MVALAPGANVNAATAKGNTAAVSLGSAYRCRSSKTAMSEFAKTLLALGLAFSAFAQTASGDTKPKDYYVGSRQFLRALYPSLDPSLLPTLHVHNRLREPDNMSMFTMELHEPDKGPAAPQIRTSGKLYRIAEPSPCPADCPCPNPVLTVEFGFDSQTGNKDLRMAWVSGPVVSCRRDRLAAEVKKHTRWSETRIRTALKTAGAAFGPDHKAEFLRVLPIEKLKPFVGDITVTSTEFQTREVTWLVRAKWHSPDGRMEADCFFEFEPFEGKLILFNRDIVPHQAPEK